MSTPSLARAAFRYRDFRLFQGARFAATIAIQMQSVAVGWQVYELTNKPLALGFVGLAQFLPASILWLVTGHAADRFDRRLIALVCQLGYALTAGLLFAFARTGVTSPLPIYATLLFFGVCRAFAGPATQALLPSLVPNEHLASAVAWSSSVWEVASISGPAFGGLLYWLGGSASFVYGASAILALAGALMTVALRVRTGRSEAKGMSLDTLFAGVAFVWKQKIILGSISLDLFAVLFGGAVALLPIFAKDILHVGPQGLGILRSAPAIGALLTAVTLAHRPLRHAGKLMFLCVALYGVATIAFGLSKSFGLSLAALAVVGAADMVSVVVRQVLVQINTPEAMRGRVSAVNLVFVGASNELGELESGVAAAWLGVVPAVVVGGLGTLVVVALWCVAFPALRNVDKLHAPTSA